MPFSFVTCSYCKKVYLKDKRYINENIKLGNNFYCSFRCQYSFKNKKKEFICENLSCNKKFKRQPSDISLHNYCSRSCSVAINNVKFPKKIAMIRKCVYCDKVLLVYRKYCSIECKSNALTISREKVIEGIKKFYQEHKRIPLKQEMWGIHKPARKYFGTWNKAIETAGFSPNPVMFAKRQIAKDGHVCDSLAEKIIDDYLYEQGISHERNIPYPEGEYTADFKIGNKLIEYFGLAGEHIRYDELRIIKKKILEKYKIYLVEIYPKDLYSKGGLERIF